MNEAGWLTCSNVQDLLGHKGEKRRSGRKLRLFAVACCRRGWELLVDPRSRQAVEAHEAYADGLIGKQDLLKVASESRRVPYDQRVDGPEGPDHAEHNAAWAVAKFQLTLRVEVVAYDMADAVNSRTTELLESRGKDIGNRRMVYEAIQSGGIDEGRFQADLFREVFGNPFRPPTIDPAWLSWNGVTIPGLALAIYDEKAFERMPILGDALEEAGCSDPVILDHCRREGGHVRGCWVLDALLGRG
jgi:hypothetical protein